MRAKVYLVGAGPGDPELLTIKALRILRQADVVLHDGLVSEAVLELAPRDALLVDAGKRCGRARVTQTEINAHMIEFARRGLTVVRLKGGDPGFFGRAGEEIDALRAAGVEFEIVPGVTAASAAAASAGISLTDRRLASRLVCLTGVGSSDQTADSGDGASKAADNFANATVVAYMPGSDRKSLRDRLLAGGLQPQTPCVLVSEAGTHDAQVHRTTVSQLAEAPVLATPCILIVGAVTAAARENASLAGWADPWTRPDNQPLLPRLVAEPQ